MNLLALAQSVVATALVAATPLLPPVASPGAADRHELIVANVQQGRTVSHPNRAGGAAFTGYTDPALERIVPDVKLRIAFEMALSDDSFRTSLAPRFLALPNARVTRQAADPSSGSESAWAYTYSSRDWVVIGDKLYQEETAVIAAVIAHEVYHAVYSDDVGRGEACLDDEVNAHTWGSRTFNETIWPIAYGPNSTVYGAAAQLVSQYDDWKGGTLRANLRDGYTRNHQCF